jgi:putative tryptophan/tyrosine transport system substrate-binding protein
VVITALGREPAGGLVVVPDGGFSVTRRGQIISLAARNRLPTIFPDSVFAKDGGLLSYGPDRADIFRRAGSYVDRILRGTHPAELPVQLPVKYELVVNLSTARKLDLTVPQSILLRADEVIQ